MTTRREVITKCGLGIAGIIVAGKAPAVIVKSLVGAKELGFSEKVETFDNPYVTDGLVAMWDGEWSNGGSGRLIDISGNRHHATGSFVFDEQTLSFTGQGQTDNTFPYDRMFFVEFVIRRQGDTAEQVLLIGGGNKTNFAFYGYGGLCRGTGYGSSVSFRGNEMAAAYFDMPNKKSWKNGILQTTTSHDAMNQYSSKLQIGRYTPSGNYPFKGKWYSVRIHSRVLTEDEIAHNFSLDKERFGL